MPEWVDRLEAAARSLPPPPRALSLLEGWHERTRAAAAQHSRHATKEAVRDVSPTPEEQRALTSLFASVAEPIYYECRDVLRRYATSQHADEPSLQLEDLLAEAYPLFLRALVRYEGDIELDAYVRRAFRDRVEDYVQSQLTRPAHPERPPPKDDGGQLPELDIPEICDELAADGFIPKIDASS